jgi:long-chain acyl-CoA synthetase
MTTAFTQIMASIDQLADKPLIETRGKWLTGAELKARIAARREDLRRAGLEPRQLAMIVVSDNLCAIEQLLACWWLGAAGCFVDFRTPPNRMTEWRGQLNPSLIVGLRAIPDVPVHVQSRAPAISPDHDVTSDAFDIDPAHLAIIFSSSGTTSRPVLNFTSQGRLAANLAAQARDANLVASGTSLSAISVAYSAMSANWLTNLFIGRPLIALDLIYRPEDLDTALKRPEVTECSLPPSEIRKLIALPDDGSPRYPHKPRLSSVGGPASPDDKLAAATRLTPNYVMTYSCVGIGIISRIVGSEVLERPASCGRPKAPIQVEIRQGDRVCAPGEEGDIVVTTETVNGRRPGDLGYLDGDGYLFITGRVQGLLCRKGVNFSAERLINASLALEGVREAAVVATANDDGGDKVHLVVQLAGDKEAELRDHLRRALPSTEQPDAIHAREHLPITAAGKVDLRALKAWVLETMD